MHRSLWVAILASLSLVAVSVSAQSAGCPADFEPTLGHDGLVYLNPCVAEAQGATIVKRDQGQRVTGARPVTAADMQAHAADSFKFLDFARVRRITAAMDGGATSAVGAPSLKGLPQDRVVLFDVARGAIYATAQPAAIRPAGPTAAISKRAVRGTPGDMFRPQEQQQQQQSPSTVPGDDSKQPPEMLTPEVTVDLPLLRGRNSPSPGPEPSPSPEPVSEPQQQQPEHGSSHSRKLRFVRPIDERRTVAEQPAGMPLASVGQLLSYGQEWHCSAALIGERTIISAAHCVYDRSSGSFARGLYFVPGRFREVNGAIRAPYGAYDVAEVYVSSQFVSGEPQDIWGCDVAVVRLQRNVQVGKVLGYFGIAVPAVEAAAPAKKPAAAAAAAAPADGAAAAAGVAEIKATTATGRQSMLIEASGRRSLQLGRQQQQQQNARLWQGQLSTAGYPSDRPEGTLVRTKCQAEQVLVKAAGSTIKLTGCSTHLGQSGSALFNDKAQVRGVVSFEIVGAGGYNGGSAITHATYHTLIRPYAV